MNLNSNSNQLSFTAENGNNETEPQLVNDLKYDKTGETKYLCDSLL